MTDLPVLELEAEPPLSPEAAAYWNDIEIIAETVALLDSYNGNLKSLGSLMWENLSDDALDELDRMITARGYRTFEKALPVMAFTKNPDAFWEEIGGGRYEEETWVQVVLTIAYYALRADIADVFQQHQVEELLSEKAAKLLSSGWEFKKDDWISPNGVPYSDLDEAYAVNENGWEVAGCQTCGGHGEFNYISCPSCLGKGERRYSI